MFWEAERMYFQILLISYFADVDLLVRFRKGSSPMHHHWPLGMCVSRHSMSMCYVKSLQYDIVLMFLGRHGMVCVFVLELPLPRETKLTEWVYSSDSDLLYGSVFEYPVVPTSDKLNFPNWQAGMINRIEFRVWNSLVVRWSMEIIWWYPGDVASKSRAWHWMRYRDVLRMDSQAIIDVAAAEEPLRNQTKRSTSAKYETEKIWKHIISASQNIKNYLKTPLEHQFMMIWKKVGFFEQKFNVFVLT